MKFSRLKYLSKTIIKENIGIMVCFSVSLLFLLINLLIFNNCIIFSNQGLLETNICQIAIFLSVILLCRFVLKSPDPTFKITGTTSFVLSTVFQKSLFEKEEEYLATRIQFDYKLIDSLKAIDQRILEKTFLNKQKKKYKYMNPVKEVLLGKEKRKEVIENLESLIEDSKLIEGIIKDSLIGVLKRDFEIVNRIKNVKEYNESNEHKTSKYRYKRNVLEDYISFEARIHKDVYLNLIKVLPPTIRYSLQSFVIAFHNSFEDLNDKEKNDKEKKKRKKFTMVLINTIKSLKMNIRPTSLLHDLKNYIKLRHLKNRLNQFLKEKDKEKTIEKLVEDLLILFIYNEETKKKILDYIKERVENLISLLKLEDGKSELESSISKGIKSFIESQKFPSLVIDEVVRKELISRFNFDEDDIIKIEEKILDDKQEKIGVEDRIKGENKGKQEKIQISYYPRIVIMDNYIRDSNSLWFIIKVKELNELNDFNVELEDNELVGDIKRIKTEKHYFKIEWSFIDVERERLVDFIKDTQTALGEYPLGTLLDPVFGIIIRWRDAKKRKEINENFNKLLQEIFKNNIAIKHYIPIEDIVLGKGRKYEFITHAITINYQ